jgi:hypothetical protein
MHGGHTNWLIVGGLIIGLAGFDFVAAVLAREWTEHRQPWQLVGSAAGFLGVFGLFVVGLRYTELTVLTFGWIVLLETGVVMIDWARYGVAMTPGRWGAVIGILALQSYLVLAPSSTATATQDGEDRIELDVGAPPADGDDDQPRALRAAS